MKNNKGFTLIELIAIITILGLIMAIAITSYQRYVTKTRQAAYDTLITTLRTAGQNRYLDDGLPTECQKYSGEDDLFKKGYMDKPADPANTGSNCRAYVYVKGTDTPDTIENYKIFVSLACSTYTKEDCKDSGGATCTLNTEEKNECGYEDIISGEGNSSNPSDPSNPSNPSNPSDPITPTVPDPTNPPMIRVIEYDDTSTYKSDTYREKIKIITLDNHINPPSNVVESWDIGVNQNGDVMAYITKNSEDDSMYNLYIQGDGVLYANPDSSNLFRKLEGVDSIIGIEKLNTSKVTDMSYMFQYTGYDSQSFKLDLGNNFDTSNVTNMHDMFQYTGRNCLSFTLNLGNKFDTSNVTNMIGMFSYTGNRSTIFKLDLGDKFDTSKVTTMRAMFMVAGQYSPVFTLNLGNKFDTSKVEDMHAMFSGVGYSNPSFTLDLGNKFDTSSAKNLSYIFSDTARKSTVFTLDLGDKFDTSNATDMEGMFDAIAYNNPTFTLDLGDKFDTSKVTTMRYMFENAGYNSTEFTLDFGNKFNTSKVKNMYWMFGHTGEKNNNLVLDLSSFDFNNVTTYDGIFSGMTSSKKIYVKDADAQNWILSRYTMGTLSTNNVLIKN